MRRFAIHTIDNDVYYTGSYSYATQNQRLDGSGVLLVQFIATNGRDQGKLHRIPFARVTSIVDNFEEWQELEGPAVNQEMKRIWDATARIYSGDGRAWAFVNYLVSGIPFGEQGTEDQS